MELDDEEVVERWVQKEEDMNQVLWASPWSFDKYLLVLHKFGKGDVVSTLSFDRTPFWTKLHGLPMRKQTKQVAEKIVGPIGTIEKVDVGSKGFSMGKYLRIRVTIDISKPLCRGRVVSHGCLRERMDGFSLRTPSHFLLLVWQIGP